MLRVQSWLLSLRNLMRPNTCGVQQNDSSPPWHTTICLHQYHSSRFFLRENQCILCCSRCYRKREPGSQWVPEGHHMPTLEETLDRDVIYPCRYPAVSSAADNTSSISRSSKCWLWSANSCLFLVSFPQKLFHHSNTLWLPSIVAVYPISRQYRCIKIKQMSRLIILLKTNLSHAYYYWIFFFLPVIPSLFCNIYPVSVSY